MLEKKGSKWKQYNWELSLAWNEALSQHEYFVRLHQNEIKTWKFHKNLFYVLFSIVTWSTVSGNFSL